MERLLSTEDIGKDLQSVRFLIKKHQVRGVVTCERCGHWEGPAERMLPYQETPSEGCGHLARSVVTCEGCGHHVKGEGVYIVCTKGGDQRVHMHSKSHNMRLTYDYFFSPRGCAAIGGRPCSPWQPGEISRGPGQQAGVG